MIAQILVIDTDSTQRRLLKNALEGYGHVVHLAENWPAGLEFLRQHRQKISVVVADLVAPGTDSQGLLAAIRKIGPETPVIVQAGDAGSAAVVQAMRSGAFDFVVKPVSAERIAAAVENAVKLTQDRGRAGHRTRSGTATFDDIVSASADMMRVVDLAQRAAQSTIPVVLEGEPGVGKELVAKAIHAGSERGGKPFVAVNCSAIPVEQMESVLFGGDGGPGGAGERQAGKFAEADGGTLFLDELGDLSPEVQVKLLRAVQAGEVETVGSSLVRKVDVRVISATNKDLIEEVREGRFREDLYYRLNVFPITIPALRKRKEDVPHLARVFAERFSAEQKRPLPATIGAEAMALLTAHDWPGNVRELENALYRAVVLSRVEELGAADFPQIAAQQPQSGKADDAVEPRAFSPAPADWRPVAPRTAMPSGPAPAHLIGVSSHTGRPDPRALLAAAYPGPENAIPTTDFSGEVRKLAEVEEELIRFALKFYRGQMSQVARKLGIGRSTLYRKLKDYDIDPDNPLKEAA